MIERAFDRLKVEAIAVDGRDDIDRRTLASVAKNARGLDLPFRALFGPDIVAEAAFGVEVPARQFVPAGDSNR